MKKIVLSFLVALALSFGAGAFALYVWPSAATQIRTVTVEVPDPCSVWWDRLAAAQPGPATYSIMRAIEVHCPP